MYKKSVFLPSMLMTLTTVLVSCVMAQEQKPGYGGHGLVGTIEIIIDLLILISIIGGVYFGYFGAKKYGGIIGKAFKIIFIGLIIYSGQHAIGTLHHFNINLMAWAGEAIHTLMHHAFTLLAFVLIAIGFYWIRKATMI